MALDRRKGVGVIAPAALCAAIVFGSILPLGLGADDTMLAPHFLLCVIYFWSVRAPEALPVPVIFLFGLLVDLFTAGPLGFWPLVCLLTYGLGLLAARFVETRGFIMLCAGFLLVAAAVECAAWAVSCAYFGAWIDPSGAVTATAAASLVFPALALVFARLAAPAATARSGA